MEKGNKMGMVAFNHNISEELAKDYDKIFTDLPGMKYEILFAATLVNRYPTMGSMGQINYLPFKIAFISFMSALICLTSLCNIAAFHIIPASANPIKKSFAYPFNPMLFFAISLSPYFRHHAAYHTDKPHQ